MNHGQTRRIGAMRLGLALLAGFAFAPTARATIVVEVLPSAAEVRLGEAFTVDLVADLGEPVLGWGLDLVLDPARGGSEGLPSIGPAWTSLATVDDDGLAGQAFPDGVLGTDLLLARVRIVPIAPGPLTFGLAITPGDLTEGFALDPFGFASDVVLVSASILVVPEAHTGMLVAVGVATLGARPRRTQLARSA